MGLFATKEEKQQRKEMKTAATLRNAKLDLENYTEDDLTQIISEEIAKICGSSKGEDLYSFGSLLSGNHEISYILDAIKRVYQQQWIVVRQNEIIIRELQKISKSMGRE